MPGPLFSTERLEDGRFFAVIDLPLRDLLLDQGNDSIIKMVIVAVSVVIGSISFHVSSPW